MINSLTKPIQVAIHGTIVVIVFICLSLGYQSCTKKKAADGLSDKDRAEQSLTEAADQSSGEFFEDDDSSDGTGIDTNYDDGENVNSDNYTDDTTADNTEADQEEPAADNSNSTTTTYSTPSSTTTSSAGSNLVIAGNYLIESNANAMVKRLKGKGYTSAAVRVFDLSQYYTVIAGRYDTRSLANSVSSELKNGGIDNYVIKRTD